jgi:hypothetical protein
LIMAKQCVGCTGKRQMAKYNTTAQEYVKQHSVNLSKLCNGVTVLNAGTTFVTWNGVPLGPGQSMTVGGNEGEEFIGRVDLNFFTQSPAPPTIINSAWVIQKFYVGENFV